MIDRCLWGKKWVARSFGWRDPDGWIIMRLGTKAEDQIVPIQVVDPSYLSLDTWLSPDQRLTIDEVWQYVAQGIKKCSHARHVSV